jgi:hypothetical protein
LIEAKYIRGSSASIFAGLTAAPLTKKGNLSRGWSAYPCWAIGSVYKREKRMSDIYRNLFDYFARNVKFWTCYSKILKVKYIFFVKNGGVAKISFIRMVNLAVKYIPSVGKPLKQRKKATETLIDGRLNYK